MDISVIIYLTKAFKGTDVQSYRCTDVQVSGLHEIASTVPPCTGGDGLEDERRM